MVEIFLSTLAAGGPANSWLSDAVESRKPNPPASTAMRSAIAFGMVIVILGVFLPGIIHAMDVFLLTLFDRATALVAALPTTEQWQAQPAPATTVPSQPAIIGQ
jgi:hypothetical protein